MTGRKIQILFCFLFLQFLQLWGFKKCAHKILENGDKVHRDEILDWHNHYRIMAVNGTIEGQPKASADSMNILKLDATLEKLALEVSKTCEFEHIEVKTAEFPKGLGQNLYRSCSNKRMKPNWKRVITNWYNEHKIYSFPNKSTIKTGHYTQLIWGATKLVGCAYTEYFEESSHKKPYCTLYVCHYAPRGNVNGESPYQIEVGIGETTFSD